MLIRRPELNLYLLPAAKSTRAEDVDQYRNGIVGHFDSSPMHLPDDGGRTRVPQPEGLR